MQNATYNMPGISQGNVMDPDIVKKLEENGWTVGTVQEFLGLTDAEMRIVEELANQKHCNRTESHQE